MEQRKITLSVEIGPIPGEVKKYRVRVNSTLCGGSFKFKESDLINELRRVGVELTAGKKNKLINRLSLSLGEEGEVMIALKRDLPEHISFQVHIETQD